MIERIEFLISRGTVDIYKGLIEPKNNLCYINQKKYEIDDKTIKKIINVIVTWKYEYGSSNILDSEEFTIIVYSNTKTTYHGKGIFPKNYNELLNIIGDIKHE